jgi:hypothetical protein
LCFSAYCSSGANFSAAGGALVAEIWAATGTDQNLAISYTGATLVATATWPLTSTPTRFSVTGQIPAGTNEVAVRLCFTPVGTAGAADSYTVQAAQLELGTIPSAFEQRLFSRDLLDCQRYYWKTFPYNVIPQNNYGNAYLSIATTLPTLTAQAAGRIWVPYQSFLPPYRHPSTVNTVMYSTFSATPNQAYLNNRGSFNASLGSGAGGLLLNFLPGDLPGGSAVGDALLFDLVISHSTF